MPRGRGSAARAACQAKGDGTWNKWRGPIPWGGSRLCRESPSTRLTGEHGVLPFTRKAITSLDRLLSRPSPTAAKLSPHGARPNGCRAPTLVRLHKTPFREGNCDSTGDHHVIQKADLDEVESSFELSRNLLIGYRRLGYTARVWMGHHQGRSIF